MTQATPRTPRLPYPELTSTRLGIVDGTTPGMPSSRLAERMEFKTLEFEVDVLDAVFNIPGRYFLKMTVQSLFTKDYSRILLRKWPDPNFTRDHEALTSVAHQKGTEQEPELCFFDDKKFTFRLPEGFCKHDRNHDVYLLIEAFKLPNNGQDMGQKAGEGKVAIYPRTNNPKTNLNVNPGEDMYRHTSVVSLLRTSSKPGKAEMHCGRMRATFSLKEYDTQTEERKKREEEQEKRDRERRRKEEEMAERRRKEQEERLYAEEQDPFKTRTKIIRTPNPNAKASTPPPDQPPVVPPIIIQSPISEWGDTSLLLPPSPSPTPPIENVKSQTNDTPLQDSDKSTFSAQPFWRHISQSHGKEQIDVIVHGASNLPSANNGKVPQPFSTLKTKSAWESGHKAKARSHAVVRPTNSPSWEEMLSIDIRDEDSAHQSLVLAANDAISKEELITYQIPISYLKPFHQYHVEMKWPSKGESEGVKFYASIIRKLSTLPKDPSSPNYLALEVFLRGVKHPVQNPVGPLIAVARIVPDYYNYKSDNLLSNPRAAGVQMTPIKFPNPNREAFEVFERSSHGYPQLSLLGRPEEQPKWNHPYLFCDQKDKATMFTPSAALVIEYYVANAAMTNDFWKIKSPVGFSSLLLNENVYKQLSAEKAKEGIRVDGVPIMGSELRASDGRPPIIGMVLKLITTDQPDSTVAMSNFDNLPVMELKEGAAPHSPEVLQVKTPPPEQEEKEGEDGDLLAPGLYLQRVNKRQLHLQDGEMPPYDAVENVLPEYQYIFVDPNQEQDTGRTANRTKPAPPSRRIAPETSGGGTAVTRDPNDLDQTHMSVLDQQMRELDNYRNAVQRMGNDILALRTQVRGLEGENHRLRQDVNNFDDHRKLLIDAADLDKLAKPELASRYAALRQKLAQQTEDFKEYKAKVQKLQNELIKKNDKEKDYLKMSHAHASQQELLQRLQDKVKKVRKLEDTCKKQEKVIEKMENVLQKLRDKGGKGNNAMNDANQALTDENKRLRQQLEDLKDQMTKAGMTGGDDQEKLELYQALERAEGRIMSLEKQLAENARNWGKERADLNIRMNEAEHGFGRAGGLGGMVLHDYPVLENNYARSLTLPSRIGNRLR